MSADGNAASGRKRKSLFSTLWRYRFLYLLFLPVFLYYLIFKYIPMFGIIIAFKDYKPFVGFAASAWVGLKHFRDFFNSYDFINIVRNTLVLNIYSIVFVFPMPIILALLLNEITGSAFKRTVQTISYLPYFISTVVVVSIITSLLSPTLGPIASLMRSLGNEPIHYLGQSKYYRAIYILSDIWQSIGYGSIIYLAALSGVDVNLYEAATIDGAGKWKQLLHITLPSIMPTIVIMLILRVGSIMDSNFEKAYLLGNSATREVSNVISTYVYTRGMEQYNYSFATAVGLFNAVISLVFVWGTNAISRRVNEVSLW